MPASSAWHTLYVRPDEQKLYLRCPDKSDRELWWIPPCLGDKWRLAWVPSDQAGLLRKTFFSSGRPKPALVKSAETFQPSPSFSSDHSIPLNLLTIFKRNRKIWPEKKRIFHCSRNSKYRRRMCRIDTESLELNRWNPNPSDEVILLQAIVKAKRYQPRTQFKGRRNYSLKKSKTGEPVFNVSNTITSKS